MALNMRSEFLGGSLNAAQRSSTKPVVGKLQVQALFKGGSKSPQKAAKQGTQKLSGAVKTAQKAVKKVCNVYFW